MKMRKPTIVIAEIGVNHDGDIGKAVRMIREAAAAGADYVKFQTFRAESLVCATAGRAEYQKKNCGGDESQLDMLRRYELTAADFAMLAEECRRSGVGFLSSAFDLESIDLLASIGMDYWKIPSGEITNLPYLRKIASVARRVIMSTGMADVDEIRAAFEVLVAGGVDPLQITILHCNTDYPTSLSDVNLLAMNSLRAIGAGAVGYSDHTVGITVAVAAVALGAQIIEKHFTLDKSLAGPDHRASADPDELRRMIEAIRETELALGRPDKAPTSSELPNRAVARKSIVASRRILKGEILSEQNMTTKRPGTGLSPMLWDAVAGTPAVREFQPDQQIEI